MECTVAAGIQGVLQTSISAQFEVVDIRYLFPTVVEDEHALNLLEGLAFGYLHVLTDDPELIDLTLVGTVVTGCIQRIVVAMLAGCGDLFGGLADDFATCCAGHSDRLGACGGAGCCGDDLFCSSGLSVLAAGCGDLFLGYQDLTTDRALLFGSAVLL